MVEAPLPCVVTIQKPNYDPRYPTIKSKMAARKKPITELASDTEASGKIEIIKVYEPAKRAAGVKIKAETPEDAVSQAIAMMKEAKVF